MITFVDVLEARRRLAPLVRRTPLAHSAWLSRASGNEVHLKLETVQATGSFKLRGAYNAVLARLARGAAPQALVTASAGNHGKALATATRALGLPLVVFTPQDAPQAKVAAIRQLGADLRTDGRDYDEAERLALAYARETGTPYISPYNDEDVIAGAATVALEMLEDRPDLDVLLVPIGGGGLASGVALAARAVSPSVTVVGVEAEMSHAFLTSVRAGALTPIDPKPTLADGLGGNPEPGSVTFDYIRQFVQQIVLVSEPALASGIVGLVEHEHVVAEGAGAATTAALLSGAFAARDVRVGAIVSGANIDRDRLTRLLVSG